MCFIAFINLALFMKHSILITTCNGVGSQSYLLQSVTKEVLSSIRVKSEVCLNGVDPRKVC